MSNHHHANVTNVTVKDTCLSIPNGIDLHTDITSNTNHKVTKVKNSDSEKLEDEEEKILPFSFAHPTTSDFIMNHCNHTCDCKLPDQDLSKDCQNTHCDRLLNDTSNGIKFNSYEYDAIHQIAFNTNSQCDCERQSPTEECFESETDVPLDHKLAQINLTGDVNHISRTTNAEPVMYLKGMEDSIKYVVYQSELQMNNIMTLITKDLSEPYSIYTYRYFIHNWPKLCFLAFHDAQCVGAIVCKLDQHKKIIRRGYIAMLAIEEDFRRRGIGSNLVTKAICAMVEDDCDEVVLETEITNKGALRLYENLGFVRDKRLFRYYLNGVDALRLKLWLR